MPRTYSAANGRWWPIARALMVPSRLVLLDEPFEGLAPAIVHEVMEALVRLRGGSVC